MSSQFKYLFTPLEIGPITVPNRIYSPPLYTRYGDKGYPTDRYAYYHGEKAKGGVGLTILESSVVHPTAEYFPMSPEGAYLYEERIIPGLKKMSDMVHEHGGRILAQLWHPGSNSDPSISYLPSVSSSPIPGVSNRLTPHELEPEEIDEMVDAYGKSAKNVVAGGFDGVELHSTHGYLIEQFFSPLFNKRTDKYGGPLENRLRFILEIIDRVREYVGHNVVLAARLCVDELMEGGLTLDEGKIIAQKLEETGKVDFLDVDATSYHNLHLMIAPMYVAPGNLIYTAAAIKKVIKKIPIGGAGRINDVTFAEKALEEGKADMIGMGRQLLADPHLPNKAREGRLDDIRPCIACNQGCLGRLFTGRAITCIGNPALGREKDWGEGSLKPVDKKKRVLVVGGGPAGMEAARVVALRGHEVHLYEKEKELGGQMNLAYRLPGREEIGNLTRWFRIQVEQAGVNIVLGKEVTLELVDELKPDVVIVATGANSIKTGMQGFTMLEIPGWQEKTVTTVEDIMAGRVKAGKNVVILDEDGGIEPPGIAEMLAAEGSKVEILTRWPHVGVDLIINANLPFVYERITRLGVKMTPNTFIKEIKGNAVRAYNIYTNDEWNIEGVDTVVLITGKAADVKLYRKLKGKVKELYMIGDCVAPRKIDFATYEGHKIGTSI